MKNTFTIKKLILTILLSVASFQCGRAVYERYAEYLTQGKIVESFALISAIILFGVLFCLILIWRPLWLHPFAFVRNKLSFLRWPIAIIICLLPGILYMLTRWSEPYGADWIRVFLYGLAIVLSAWVLSNQDGVCECSFVYASFCFSVITALMLEFHDVSSYPFSIGWSEGNRMWDYSVLFGRDLYDYPAAETIPAYIDIGRQSLWGAVFLLPQVSILLMRLWSAFLFTIPYGIFGWLLLRNCSRKTILFAFGCWTMIFLMQGPIYTPLILAAILVALSRKTPLWISCLLALVAGGYAVMSRSSWVVGPAAYAVMLAFAEVPPNGTRSIKQRWTRAIALGLSGLAGALLYHQRESLLGLFGVQKTAETVDQSAAAAAIAAVPPLFSPQWFTYYFTRQEFLWDRLWPNETYQFGIIGGLLLAILPLLILLIIWRVRHPWKLDFLQTLLLVGCSVIFLCAGIMISVKIGGGSNLHNLDLFLISIVIITALAWESGFGDWLCGEISKNSPVCLVVLCAILIPVTSSALSIDMRRFPSSATTQDALQKINQVIEEHPDDDILFMDQRQLLTFGFVPKIHLIADYEKKWMMDEAMADNSEFFQPYIEDLKAQRFAAIITEPLHIKFQGSGLNFSEENDYFVKWVSLPTLCYYEPYETFDGEGVQILLPRSEVLVQEGVVCP